jgi:PAS domain S-box-containing protein
MARILVVDDEKGIRVTLVELLRDAGHEAHAVADAELAVARLGVQEFDVLVTDIILPRVSGMDLLEVARRMVPDTEVILITGDPALDTATRALRAGAFNYLAKPISGAALCREVAAAAEAKARRDHDRAEQQDLQARVAEQRRALEESEARYRDLVENAPLGILSIDRGGRILEINAKLLQILGSNDPEATRAINILTFPLLDHAGITADLQRCLETGETLTAERPYVTLWDKTTYLRYHLRARLDDHGAIAGLQAIVEDVSDIREAREELAHLEERLRLSMQDED